MIDDATKSPSGPDQAIRAGADGASKSGTDQASTLAAPLPPRAAPGKTLTPAAQRALEEAQARFSAENATDTGQTTPGADADASEKGGPSGPEPTRFGDWEKGGRAYDF